MTNPLVPIVFFFLPMNSDYVPNPEFSGIILELDSYTGDFVFENFAVPSFVDGAPYGALSMEEPPIYEEETNYTLWLDVTTTCGTSKMSEKRTPILLRIL